jgi:hypothetical protein
LFVIKQQRRPDATISQQTDRDMGAHAAGEAMVDGAQLEVDAPEDTKGAL